MNRQPIEMKRPTLITVFTGFLGSGKTSIIVDLIKDKKLAEKERLCILKNEFGKLVKTKQHSDLVNESLYLNKRLADDLGFNIGFPCIVGDNEIDSKLFELGFGLQENSELNSDSKGKEKEIKSALAVKEILNGCLCCVLVGQMKNALLELKQVNDPDRIIIETSGSAFPAPIAWQIRELDQSQFQLDSIITVIDCINFKGYEDTSYTAKMQAQYTDLILLNKYELISERELDLVIDSVNDLNTDTPKLKWSRNCSDSSLLFNLPIRPFTSQSIGMDFDSLDVNHHSQEIDMIHISSSTAIESTLRLESFLQKVDKECVYRIKGILALGNHEYSVLNWAFGRWELTLFRNKLNETNQCSRVTVMGVGLGQYINLFNEMIPHSTCSLTVAHPVDQP